MADAAPSARLTVGQLSDRIAALTDGRLQADLLGASDLPIEGVAPLDEADARHISFLANIRYRRQAVESRAAAIVLSTADVSALFPNGRQAGALVLCANPYAWFALAAQQLFPQAPLTPGVDPSARVSPTAKIDPSARIDAYAVIGSGAVIGPGAWVGSGSHIANDVVIGASTRLYPGVHVYHGCTVGDRCIVHSGAVIGADGFGFAPLGGRYIKIPQTGVVVIGSDVEIGANTTIDRGTMGDTVIGDGVKIDNQVQIAHNVKVGASTVIAGCVGIAGSAVIGERCQLGGAAMIHGHITLADGVIVSGGTLISRSIGEPGFYSGVFPHMPNRDWERNAAVVRHLDDLRTRLRRLERQVADGASNASEDSQKK